VSVLVVFDLDGTITRRDSMMPFVFRWLAGRPRHWWRLPLAIPTLLQFALGRADRGDLKGMLLHVTLGGMSRTSIDTWARGFVRELIATGLFPDALERIQFHRKAGHRLVLMSASVDCYVPMVGRELGFSETVCTQVRWLADGRLDGRLSAINCRGVEKLRQLRLLRERLRPDEVWAYGNSRADLVHMMEVTHGVYVNGSLKDVPATATHIECVRWV
jgi:phosphatidylglycerophosphatase C